MSDFLHNDPEFNDLMAIVSAKHGIDISLIEKDYWIMHSLYGLQKLGIEFELKGGTSLSKGYGLIQRFSEDIDLHIRTNFGFDIEGKEDKPKIKEARKAFAYRYKTSSKLYYGGQPDFELVLAGIQENIIRL